MPRRGGGPEEVQAAAGGGPPIDWKRPFGTSPVVSSVREAERLVTFEVRKPAFGVEPSLIQVEYPNQVEPRERTLAFVYELPRYGIVVVNERLSHFTQADLEARANEPTVPEGAFRMVQMESRHGSVDALLVSSARVGRLLWIDEGILFDITGPAVSPEAVVSLGVRL
jgi:hypothetical protein